MGFCPDVYPPFGMISYMHCPLFKLDINNETTKPQLPALDCSKFPYGCCPEDPFPENTGPGCPHVCLCKPLGTY